MCVQILGTCKEPDAGQRIVQKVDRDGVSGQRLVRRLRLQSRTDAGQKWKGAGQKLDEQLMCVQAWGQKSTFSDRISGFFRHVLDREVRVSRNRKCSHLAIMGRGMGVTLDRDWTHRVIWLCPAHDPHFLLQCWADLYQNI